MSPAEYVLAEIASQPDCWQRAAELAPNLQTSFPSLEARSRDRLRNFLVHGRRLRRDA